MFKFSKRSLDNLRDVHILLQNTCSIALRYSKVDFGVSEGLRTKERQAALVSQGKSKTMNSKHLTGDAIDIFAANGYTFDYYHLCYLAGVFQVAFEIAKKELNLTNVSLRWGGDWSANGVLIHDQTFQDLVHFELVWH